MINIFQKNIKDIMQWSQQDYIIFLDRYRQAISLFRPKSKSALYSQNYFDCCIPLFLVYQSKLMNPKAFLIALILNGMPKDSTNFFPSIVQETFLNCFFDVEDKELLKLFDKNTIKDVYCLCLYDLTDEHLIYSDTLNLFDLNLFNDFRLFFCSVSLPTCGIKSIVYHMNPRSVKYIIEKNGKMDIPLYISELFLIKNKIENENMKYLYGYKIRAFIKYAEKII